MTWMRTKPASGWPGGAPHAAGDGVIAGAMVPGDGDVVIGTDAGRGERVVGWLRGVGVGWVGVVSVLATAAVLAASLMLRDRSFEDLAVYRIGVRTWLHGGDMYGPLPPAHPGGLVLPFIYPPFAALVLSPLALLPWPVAWTAMLLLSLVSLVTVVGVPASLLLDRVAQTFWFGQVNLLLMALVAVDCLASPRWPRGGLVGVAAAIKLTPAAFVLLLVVRRDYRAAGTAGVTFAGAALVGFAVAPASSWQFWTGRAQGLGGLAGSSFASNQAIRGALARWDTLPAAVQTGAWLGLCLLVGVLAVAGMRRALDAGNLVLAWVVNGALALLVSPISWGHHWVYVVPALLGMTALAVHSRGRWWTRAAVVTAVVFVLHPYHFLPMGDGREQGWSWWEHLIGNAYGLLTVAGLLILAWPATTRWRRRGHATDVLTAPAPWAVRVVERSGPSGATDRFGRVVRPEGTVHADRAPSSPRRGAPRRERLVHTPPVGSGCAAQLG